MFLMGWRGVSGSEEYIPKNKNKNKFLSYCFFQKEAGEENAR